MRIGRRIAARERSKGPSSVIAMKMMTMMMCGCCFVALASLLCLRPVDGYQVKRRSPSSVAPRPTTRSRKGQAAVVPTATTDGKSRSKRNYRNDVHQEDGRIDDTSSSPANNANDTNKPRRKMLQSPLVVRRRPKASVRTVDELRRAVLDQGLGLSEIAIVGDDEQEAAGEGPASVPTDFFHDHAVRELIKDRYERRSTPGRRTSDDASVLALSIEGGGMRGCVSAGMVAAIASLGLADTIDRVYGSSAGSVVGAYLISRQVCMDVYVDILPASKELFVCKRRMIKSLASSLVDVLVGSLRKESAKDSNDNENSVDSSASSARLNPGMNISFVLDGIMGRDHGIRPLDLETFWRNDARQPLRVVSSTVDPTTGRLRSRCFGTKDFLRSTAVEKADGSRQGLFACLEASMTVPVRRTNRRPTAILRSFGRLHI